VREVGWLERFREWLHTRHHAPVHHVTLAELEPFDVHDHDDDEGTDHLARLSDPECLARVVALDDAEGGAHYAVGAD
jgi:hypothetical protein